MARCPDCRKYTDDTWWEMIRGWFFNMFQENIKDLSTDRYTQGFSDGYKEGMGEGSRRTRELMTKVYNLE